VALPLSADRNVSIKKKIMKLRLSKYIFAATAGLALTLSAQAQLNVNVREQATFGSFVGGVGNSVTNNGSINTIEVVTTGTPAFDITYTPLFGPGGPIALGTGTLNVPDLACDDELAKHV
jgi:hypothetical protein